MGGGHFLNLEKHFFSVLKQKTMRCLFTHSLYSFHQDNISSLPFCFSYYRICQYFHFLLQNLTADYSMESHVRDLENYVNVARNRRRRAKALLDFERHDDDELGFRKNDIITVGVWCHHASVWWHHGSVQCQHRFVWTLGALFFQALMPWFLKRWTKPGIAACIPFNWHSNHFVNFISKPVCLAWNCLHQSSILRLRELRRPRWESSPWTGHRNLFAKKTLLLNIDLTYLVGSCPNTHTQDRRMQMKTENRVKMHNYIILGDLGGVRAVPEIILRRGGQTLFCPVGGGCFVDSVSEGWGVGR